MLWGTKSIACLLASHTAATKWQRPYWASQLQLKIHLSNNSCGEEEVGEGIKEKHAKQIEGT